MVELADFIRLRRGAPDRIDAGEVEQHFRATLARRRHQHDADALAAGTAGAAGAMLHDLGIVRNIGVDHGIEVRQIDAARRRLGSLVLGQFTG